MAPSHTDQKGAVVPTGSRRRDCDLVVPRLPCMGIQDKITQRTHT